MFAKIGNYLLTVFNETIIREGNKSAAVYFIETASPKTIAKKNSRFLSQFSLLLFTEIIKKNSILDISESLRFLINNREKREKFGINARQTCKNYLETSVCANNQLEIFKEVVNSRQC